MKDEPVDLIEGTNKIQGLPPQNHKSSQAFAQFGLATIRRTQMCPKN